VAWRSTCSCGLKEYAACQTSLYTVTAAMATTHACENSTSPSAPSTCMQCDTVMTWCSGRYRTGSGREHACTAGRKHVRLCMTDSTGLSTTQPGPACVTWCYLLPGAPIVQDRLAYKFIPSFASGLNKNSLHYQAGADFLLSFLLCLAGVSCIFTIHSKPLNLYLHADYAVPVH
jgi:hypothetical protein